MPGDYGSPREMTSTIYISNNTISVVQSSSVSPYTFKTIQIPGDTCIYFIHNGRTICFQEFKNHNMSLLSSGNDQPFEYIHADTQEIMGFSTTLFRQYQVDSSLDQVKVDTLYMLGTTEIKSSLNISIEGKKRYSVFPLKFMLKSQYGCMTMELTEFEKDIPKDVFIFDRNNVEYFENLESYFKQIGLD
jgi:hypothetical protein